MCELWDLVTDISPCCVWHIPKGTNSCLKSSMSVRTWFYIPCNSFDFLSGTWLQLKPFISKKYFMYSYDPFWNRIIITSQAYFTINFFTSVQNLTINIWSSDSVKSENLLELFPTIIFSLINTKNRISSATL